MSIERVVQEQWSNIMRDFAKEPTRYMNYISHSLGRQPWSTKTDMEAMDLLLVIWLDQVRKDMKAYCKPRLSYLSEKIKHNYTWLSERTSKLRDHGYLYKKQRIHRQEDGSFLGSSCIYKFGSKLKTLFHIVFNTPSTHFGFNRTQSSLKKERNTNPLSVNSEPTNISNIPSAVQNPLEKLQKPSNMDKEEWINSLLNKVYSFKPSH